MVKYIFFNFGKIVSFIYLKRVNEILLRLTNTFKTGYISRNFKSFGKNVTIKKGVRFLGESYIDIGNNVNLGRFGTLTAWSKYLDQTFIPEIIIRDNVSIGDNFHITANNSIIIESGVLMGQKITITDNLHGTTDDKLVLNYPPSKRHLVSKGKVFIDKNVWLGDKVTITSGVIIGVGSIIAANSVVTKNVPPYSIVGGIPAKVIRTIEN
jgi:acetyltransferase-like isoleucine patch superfamily enzyme